MEISSSCRPIISFFPAKLSNQLIFLHKNFLRFLSLGDKWVGGSTMDGLALSTLIKDLNFNTLLCQNELLRARTEKRFYKSESIRLMGENS